MNEQRKNDYERIINLNESANTLYDKLANLEFEGKVLNEEYIEYVKLIEKINQMTKGIINKYPLNDKFIESYIANIQYEKKFKLDEFINYIKEDKDMNYKRFIEDCGEFDLECNINNPKGFEGTISFDDEEFDLDFFMNNCDDNLYNFLMESGIGDYYKESLTISYNRLNLFMNTFTDYVIYQINMLSKPELRLRLIKFKYNLLKLYRCLEDNFLINPRLFTQSRLYQKAFTNYYPNEMEVFVSFDKNNAEIAEQTMYEILSIDYDSYRNFDDPIKDLLNVAYIKTLASTMSSEHNVNVIKNGLLKAISLSNNKISKILLANCCNLNSGLLLHKELEKKKDDNYARN